ncbi:MAG TPA: DUF4097 family beta strand repeat-containing protein [Prolixibacteraceae bacterium]|nr:DUF4097 family beta strand repeat-containing protein [Prolixibacteraceae bacterium]
MKTHVFNLLLIAGLLASSSPDARAEYVKKVYKSWPAREVQTLNVENKFGNITFLYTRTDSVVINIQVEIKNLSGSKAQNLADMIRFKFSSSDGIVKATTTFDDDFKTNQDFEINYTIYIQEDKNLMIENKYGNLVLGNLNAKGMFDIAYGNITGKNLSAPDDEFIRLELKYGTGFLAEVNRLEAKIGYSKFRSDQVATARLDTKYSVLSIERCGRIMADSRYDNYQIDKVQEATIDTKFTGWSINELNKILKMENQYGDIDIDHVSPHFESIRLENQYGNIQLGMASDARYSLKAQAVYCKVRYPRSAETFRYIEDNNNITIDAVVGGGEPESTIVIESQYGNVDLME